MTRGQRRAHLAAWLVLGPLLLAALAWAIVDRPAAPRPGPEEPPRAAPAAAEGAP